MTVDADGGEEPEYDATDMKILLRSRDAARAILADASNSVQESLALLLAYSYQAQAELNGVEIASGFDADTLLDHAKKYARDIDFKEIINFFKELEILTPEWESRLNAPSPALWDDRFRTIARYFVDRYWLQAISDFDLVGRVKFALLSCIVIRLLGGDLLQTAQNFSKEIENSIENVEAILDAAYDEPIFSDVCLFGMLLL